MPSMVDIAIIGAVVLGIILFAITARDGLRVR